MRNETVSRSYAETLFELARRHEGVERYGEGIEVVARLLEENPDVRLFLETPRIAAAEKKAVIRRVFEGELPPHLVNFLLVIIDKRRQRLLRDIARAYHELVDEHLDRAHVEVTLARPMAEGTVERMAEQLSKLLGKTAIPHVRVKPEIIGGVVVRTGDTIYDGSIRRRMERMRRRMLAADMPTPVKGAPSGASDTPAGAGPAAGA